MATSRAEWARRVRRWQKSGLTSGEFGEREGFNGGRLSWWKWRLGSAKVERSSGRRGERGARPRRGSPAPAFLPARLVTAMAQPVPVPAATIEIAVGNGWVVRVTGGEVDVEQLEQVLVAVGRARS